MYYLKWTDRKQVSCKFYEDLFEKYPKYDKVKQAL